MTRLLKSVAKDIGRRRATCTVLRPGGKVSRVRFTTNARHGFG